MPLSQLNYALLAKVDEAHRVILTLKLNDTAAQSVPLAAGIHRLGNQPKNLAMGIYLRRNASFTHWLGSFTVLI